MGQEVEIGIRQDEDGSDNEVFFTFCLEPFFQSIERLLLFNKKHRLRSFLIGQLVFDVEMHEAVDNGSDFALMAGDLRFRKYC